MISYILKLAVITTSLTYVIKQSRCQQVQTKLRLKFHKTAFDFYLFDALYTLKSDDDAL